MRVSTSQVPNNSLKLGLNLKPCFESFILKFEYFRDFMPAQVICKFHKVSTKTKQTIPRTRLNNFYVVFGNKGQVNPKSISWSYQNLNSSEILLPVDVICKSNKHPNKTKTAMLRTRLNIVFVGTQEQVHVTPMNSPIKLQTRPIFYGWSGFLQVWRWFDQTKRLYHPDNIRSIILVYWKSFLSLKGK